MDLLLFIVCWMCGGFIFEALKFKWLSAKTEPMDADLALRRLRKSVYCNDYYNQAGVCEELKVLADAGWNISFHEKKTNDWYSVVISK